MPQNVNDCVISTKCSKFNIKGYSVINPNTIPIINAIHKYFILIFFNLLPSI